MQDNTVIFDYAGKEFVGMVQIRYDANRPNGYWYASVPVARQIHLDDRIKNMPLLSRSQRTLEIILNGPGRRKAREKINRYLLLMDIHAAIEDSDIVVVQPQP